MFILFGLSGHHSSGFNWRNPPSHLPESYFSNSSKNNYLKGINNEDCVSTNASMCKLNDTESHENILLLGDSIVRI